MTYYIYCIDFGFYFFFGLKISCYIRQFTDEPQCFIFPLLRKSNSAEITNEMYTSLIRFAKQSRYILLRPLFNTHHEFTAMPKSIVPVSITKANCLSAVAEMNLVAA